MAFESKNSQFHPLRNERRSSVQDHASRTSKKHSVGQLLLQFLQQHYDSYIKKGVISYLCRNLPRIEHYTPKLLRDHVRDAQLRKLSENSESATECNEYDDDDEWNVPTK